MLSLILQKWMTTRHTEHTYHITGNQVSRHDQNQSSTRGTNTRQKRNVRKTNKQHIRNQTLERPKRPGGGTVAFAKFWRAAQMFGVRGSHGAIARGTIFECSCLWVSTHKPDVAANDVYPKRDCTTRGYSGRGWAHTRCTPNARLSQRPYPRRYLPIAILSPIATPRNQHTRAQATPPPQLARPPPQHLQHHRRHRHNQHPLHNAVAGQALAPGACGFCAMPQRPPHGLPISKTQSPVLPNTQYCKGSEPERPMNRQERTLR